MGEPNRLSKLSAIQSINMSMGIHYNTPLNELSRIGPLWLRLGVLMGLPLFGSASLAIRSEGILTYKAPQASQTRLGAPAEEVYAFTVLSDGKHWKMALDALQPTNHPTPHAEIGCDGTTLYVYKEFGNSQAPRLNNERPSIIKNNGTPVIPVNKGIALIIPDTVPNPIYSRCEVLWLAFCSADHFKTNTHGLARRIWMESGPLDVVFTNASVSAEWEWLAGQAFVSRVRYFNARVRKELQTAVAEYRVVKSHEQAGIHVPTAFELERFSQRNLPARTTLIKFECVVTNTMSVTSFEPRPEIRVPVLMSDYRFRDVAPSVDSIRRIVTNGAWQDVATVSGSKEVAMARRVDASQVRSGQSDSHRIFGLLFIASATLLALVVSTYMINKSKQRSERVGEKHED